MIVKKKVQKKEDKNDNKTPERIAIKNQLSQAIILTPRTVTPNYMPDGKQKQTKFKILKRPGELQQIARKIENKSPMNLAIDTINRMARNDLMPQ